MYKKLQLTLLVYGLTLTFFLNAQIPDGYYDGTTGLTGETLKTKLNTIIDGHTELSYDAVWNALKETDKDPSNASNIILLYTGRSQDADATIGSGDGSANPDNWNREHVWAKSHGGFDNSSTPGTDLHHLRPTDISVNGDRGNLDFDNGGTAHDEATDCKSDADSWEPRDAIKGDIARMIFYMATRYEGLNSEVDLEIADAVTNGSDPTLGIQSTLVAWHNADPVDDFETNRNNIIYSNYQSNRNPFIDHPEFVSAIWGDPAAAVGGDIKNQDFESLASDNWSFTLNPPSYNAASGTDVWDDVTSLGSISGPQSASMFWGMRDLNNDNGGNSDFHTLTFDNVDISSYTDVKINFFYYTDGYDGTDIIKYQVFEDNVGQSEVELNKNTDAWTEANINITAGVSQVRIVFSAKQNGGSDYAGLDNISLTGTSGNDSEAPTAPTGLAGSNITATTVDLNWTASTDNIGVTAYDVFRDGNLIGSPATNSFNVTGLTAATSYAFTVKAKDAAGNTSDASNTANVTTTAAGDVEAPTAPASLAGANITLTTVDLSWTAATDNVGVTAYDVFRDGNLIGSPATNSFNVTGLTPGTAYAFTVKAKDAAGNASDASNTANITTLADSDAPTAPANLAASNITATTLDLNWDVSTDNIAVTAYDVFRDGNLIGSPATNSFNVTGLTNSTAYAFTVKAKDAAGNASDASNTANATTLDSDPITELFFSEYVEGSSNNKALEIANFTAGAIDLSSYSIKKQSNGAGSWGSELTLSGTLNANDVYVIANSNASAAVTAVADLTTGSGTVTFNGNDPIGLFKNGNLIDVIGTFDGGSGDFAKDATLRRKNSVTAPNTTYTVAEWDSFAQDTFDGLGTHGPDNQAPTAPTGLAGSNITATTVDLNWTASTDNIGVTGYEVYQGENLIASPSTNSYNVTGLTESTSYAFTVKAKDAAGNTSDASNTANVTTTAAGDVEAPTAPASLAGAIITLTSVDLSWTVSNDNVGVTAYDVFRDGNLIGSPNTNSFNVTGLTSGTAYAFTVKAKDAAGNVSAASNTANITTLADSDAPTAPANLAASNITATTLDLNWDVSTDNVAVTAYDVFRDGNLIGSPVTNSFNVTGLTNSTAYAFTVKAKDAAGNASDPSNTANATTLDSDPITELFFSEYVEGSSNNKALEIANFTAGAIDLSSYSIKKQSNGAGSWGSELTLSGTLNANDVYVIANSNASTAVTAVADLTTGSGAVTFNGNDPIGLFKNGNLIDVIGTFDGGSSDFAKDATLRRKNSVTAPNTTYTVAEWDSFAQDTFDGLGTHGPDNQAPTAPTGLAGSNITATTVDLNWTASTDNIGVTAYDVFRDGNLIGSPATNSFNVTGLTESTSYAFTVKAKDAAGNTSDASNTANVTTTAAGDVEAPTAPASLAGANITLTTVDLSWTAATDNVGVTAYDVFRDGNLIGSPATNSFNVTGLTPGTAYAFTVKAKDAAGNASDASNTANITTLADSDAPTAPANLAASNITATTLDLNWDVSTDNVAVTAYDVFRDGNLIGSPATNSFNVTGLTNSTAYAFTVKAKDAAGNASDASNTANATTLDSDPITELFFSEYVEGSSNNKALEIANFTAGAIDLSSYSIKKQSNGAGSWGSELTLSGTLNANDVYVIANSNASAAITGVADLTTGSGAVTFNGNDPIGLFKNGNLIDVIGTFDGGSGDFAKDATLRRKNIITAPNTTYTVAEWDSFAQDTFDGLGNHSTAPNLPTNLQGNAVSATQIDISWIDNSSNETGFTLQRSLISNDFAAATNINIGANSTTHNDNNLNGGTTYFYRIKANGNQDSNYTDQISVSTPCNIPTNVVSSGIGDNTITLNWDAITGVTSYEVQYRIAGIPASSVSLNSNTNSINVTGLFAGTNYEIRVRSVCIAGQSFSQFTGFLAFTTTGSVACAVPTNGAISNISDTGITFSWDAVSGANSYDIQYRIVGVPNSANIVNSNTNSLNVTGLNAGTNYEIRVKTVCTAGQSYSEFSSYQSFTTTGATACDVPSNGAVSNISDNGITFSWDAVSGAESYDVQYRIIGVPASSTIVNNATNSINLSGLNAGTNYEIRVKTICTEGTLYSEFSTYQNFTTTGAAACAIPANGAVSNISDNGITFSWDAVSGAESYQVQYRVFGIPTTSEIINSATNSTNISGLDAGTIYEIRVKTICTAGQSYSEYSSFQSFTTTGAVACAVPGSISLSSIADNSVNISWGAVSGALTYQVQYRIVGVPASAIITNFAGINNNITGLFAGTDYEIRVRTICTSNALYSEYSSFQSFTTTGSSACAIPAGLSVTGIADNQATYNWGSVSGAESYQIQYRELNNPSSAVIISSASTSEVITGLSAGTNYEIRIKTVCTAGQLYSDYSLFQPFTTTGSSSKISSKAKELVINEQLSNTSEFMVYPNPSEGLVNIKIENPVSQDLKLMIYNATGKLVYLSREENSIHKQINLKQFGNGMYFIRIISDNLTQTKRVIIK